MKIQEAIKMFEETYPNCKIDNLTETDNYFIIGFLVCDKKNMDPNVVPMISNHVKAIDKKTGSMFTYNPLIHN